MVLEFFTGMSFQRLLALLAHLAGETEVAIGHFERALIVCRDSGLRPELGWASHDYASALAVRGKREDTRRILLLLEEGYSLA